MIRFLVFAGLALAIATPAEAMSPPPLPQSDGIRADVGYRGVARGHGYAVARGYAKKAGNSSKVRNIA